MSLSIISFNIMFNNILQPERMRALIALLLKNAPNVICLQEVSAELVALLTNSLKNYVCVPTKINNYGQLIFVESDIQIIETAIIDLPTKMGRQLLYAQICKAGQIYNITTFHLESLNCAKTRKAQFDIMMDKFGKMDNAILCGDTNMKNSEKYNLPEKLIDAWTHTDGKIGEYTYWGSRYWNNSSKERYDKIFYSNDLQLKGFGMLGTVPIANLNNKWISDHDGIFCKL